MGGTKDPQFEVQTVVMAILHFVPFGRSAVSAFGCASCSRHNGSLRVVLESGPKLSPETSTIQLRPRFRIPGLDTPA